MPTPFLPPADDMPAPPRNSLVPEQTTEVVIPAPQEYLQPLQEMLRSGVLVENSIWSFKMTDWIVGLQAVDIDGDGDREILIASRDGWVKAFTRYGSLKWERTLPGQRFSALAVRPPSGKATEGEPCVILGLRSGKVIALNKDGNIFPNWEYDIGYLVRQIAISEHEPDVIVIGSEDRSVHVVEGTNGHLLWKYPTAGWVRSVCIYDLDGDGQEEILAGSGDHNLSIFTVKGELLYSFSTAYQIYALAAGPLETGGPAHIITSSNYKSLSAWKITRLSPTGEWHCSQVWSRSPAEEDPLFRKRVHSIYVEDLNKDGMAEILAGSEDGHLVVLDRAGELLWKRDFGACVNRVSAVDLNYDGQIEVLVGTENNAVYVFQLELVEHLYPELRKIYRAFPPTYNWKPFVERLSPRERALLEDLTSKPPSRRPRMELEIARNLIQEQHYEQALTILSRLLHYRVQYCWSSPFQARGYIRSGFFSSSAGEFLLGSDRGYIYALDISQEEAVLRWQRRFVETEGDEFRNRIRMLAPGPRFSESSASILAVLASQRVLLLDHAGNPLQNHSLAAEESWPRGAYFSSGKDAASSEILLGMEDHRISIWDSTLSAPIDEIATSRGVGVICTCDLVGDGTVQIIFGSLKGGVSAYTRKGEELWHFKTQDRTQALHIVDIDLDGRPEIIVGSEDRNIYVLNYEGKLKWRYPTDRDIMSIDVCDAKMPRDSEAPRRLTPIILAGSGDGYLYIFDGYGDLLWKHQFSNRVRLVRARKVDGAGTYEFAVAYEDKLELLQLLDKDELVSLSDECWKQLTRGYGDHARLRQLADHEDEFIRGDALAKLAGSEVYEKENFLCIQRALRSDTSLQVKLKLVNAIVNFCRLSQYHGEYVHQARQLLEGLYRAPEREVRLKLVEIFPLVADTDLFFGLFFENLERSTDHADVYVRRAVVRRLDWLLEVYPERSARRVFSLLLKTARDEETWVRQETGRALAHYFKRHVANLVADLVALLDHNTDLMILEQITYSIKHPALKGLFQNMRRQIDDLEPKNLLEILDEAIVYLRQINALGATHGEEWLQMYEEFRQFARSKTISALASYQRITRSELLLATPLAQAGLVVSVFDTLAEVAHTIARYERRQTVGERVTTLIQAQHLVENLRGSFLRQTVGLDPPERQEAHAPENRILALLVEQWWKVINKELAHISGSAILALELGTSIITPTREVVVSLRVRNDGQCAADNVRVEIVQSADYHMLEKQPIKQVAEISTRFPVHVEFRLRFHRDMARVAFELTYDDAEHQGKRLSFADEVRVQSHQRVYHPIANPYTTGTPIRQKEMFYGRSEDLAFLQSSLGSLSANRVVLLWGQRRMGKTSLIYRLAAELAVGPCYPVFIDMQQFALKANDAQLLEGFARCIQEQIWFYKKLRIDEPVPGSFAADPSAAFHHYLASLWQWLPEQRLILLIDEFDGMGQYIERNGDTILHYLRNLMQHYPGLNFLLSGAPYMPYVEGYQAIFFNIAQSRRLGKFKPDEARELIIKPVYGDLDYDPLAVDKMMAVTDGWPYFIHVMSEKLIQHCNATQKSYVTISEVNAALNIVLNEQETSIRWIWQDLSSPTEKLILSLLAQEGGEEGRVFSLNDIYRKFEVFGVLYEPREVTEALSRLVKGSFVEESFDGVQYRIPVGLIKAWLRKEKPPARVVREEDFFASEEEF